jgi:hypothetical protein
VRKHLYRELDLKTSPYREYFEFELARFTKQRSKNEIIFKSNHLHKYIKSLALTITTQSSPGEWICNSVAPWIPLAVQIRENLEHFHLQIPQRSFVAVLPPQLEQILASPSLKSVTLDQDPTGSLFEIRLRPRSPEPFPRRVLRSISESVTKLEIKAPGALNKQWDLGPSTFGNPKVETQSRPRYLEDFSLTLFPPCDRIAGWTKGLAEPFFNLNLSRAKRITISSAPNDDSLWKLPDEASETLEELTITRLPVTRKCSPTTISCSFGLIHRNNSLERLAFIHPDRLARYRALRSLSIGIIYESRIASADQLRVGESCRSLIDLFAQPFPPTLRHISINVALGLVLDTIYDCWRGPFPEFFDKEIDLGWSELDQVLAEQPSLESLTIDLSWESVLAMGFQSGSSVLTSHAGADQARKEELQVFYGRWRELFGRVADRGMLNLRCSWF